MKQKKEKKKNSLLSDFKQFVARGNIVDLAIAVIIGGAFGTIITSLVNDIIMPLISLALGGINFVDLKWVIRAADEVAGITETALGYGAFIQTVVDFLIIAFCIFMVIRIFSNAQRKLSELKKSEEAAPAPAESAPQEPPKPTQEELLTEIRDLLKEQNKQ